MQQWPQCRGWVTAPGAMQKVTSICFCFLSYWFICPLHKFASHGKTQHVFIFLWCGTMTCICSLNICPWNFLFSVLLSALSTSVNCECWSGQFLMLRCNLTYINCSWSFSVLDTGHYHKTCSRSIPRSLRAFISSWCFMGFIHSIVNEEWKTIEIGLTLAVDNPEQNGQGVWYENFHIYKLSRQLWGLGGAQRQMEYGLWCWWCETSTISSSILVTLSFDTWLVDI